MASFDVSTRWGNLLPAPRPPDFISPESYRRRSRSRFEFGAEAEAVRLSGERSARSGAGEEMKKADERRLGGDRRPARGRRLSLQLPRRRRVGRSTRATRNERVERQHLEPGLRAGLGALRHEGRAARRGGRGHLPLEDAARGSAACTSTRRRATRTGEGKYPVFYLLHGAGDCDDSWTSVGRAGFILDNLIAAGKAKPMIVVMPAGHTGRSSFGGGGGESFQKQMDEFGEDFAKDVRPYVEKTLPRAWPTGRPGDRRPVDGRRRRR